MTYKEKFFFVGIGGVSMSVLARYLKQNGNQVEGSDLTINEYIKVLNNEGIITYLGHDRNNIKPGFCVVYNYAINLKTNPEILEAKRLNLPIISRANLLALISKDFRYVIAVSGTHGKTTTTSMISEIFTAAGLKPTAHIGGITNNLGDNFLSGDKNIFITEACEYKNSFKYLHPTIGVVLNVDLDHVDFFKNISKTQKVFNYFKKHSEIVVCEHSASNKKDTNITFGINEGNYQARNLSENDKGQFSFDCYKNERKMGKIELGIVLEHNVKNALAAIAVCDYFQISFKVIKDALKNFRGIKRRFEYIGTLKHNKIFIDYAHHPREIYSTLKSANKLCKNKLHTIFQPHTYSRTKRLMPDFIKSLINTDLLYIYKTYPAREEYDEMADAKKLYENINIIKNAEYYETYEELKTAVEINLSTDDIILILGAGDISNFANFLIENN